MISPFKAALGLDYREFEGRLARAVHLRFGLPAEPDPALARLIKRADRASAFFEATQLAGFTEAEAARFFGRPRFAGAAEIRLAPSPTGAVQRSYLARFAALASAV
jgi:5'-deoxynucleotidase YfbR-like HD superfamily hydrolase